MHGATRFIAAGILGRASRGEPLASGPRLVVVSGLDEGRWVPVCDGDILGRGRAAQVPLRDPAASRQHARIEERDGRFAILDLGSKNGVEVNGRLVRARAALQDGDVVRVGATLLEAAGLAAAARASDSPEASSGTPAGELAPSAGRAPSGKRAIAASALLLAAGSALVVAAL